MPEWHALAHQRAAKSAEPQAPVILRHGLSLAHARNEGLALVQTEWVIFLDADDELEPGYVEALEKATADLRAPSVRYVRNGHEQDPWMPQVAGHRHQCSAECLREGNWLVVGTPVRTELLRDVGGWREFPVYEDWDVWLRCWRAGATIEPVPEAVYRAHVRSDSRNRGPAMAEKNRVHQDIVRANFPDLQEAM
jgi:glycosyltransferase involved in cell wall biosynthesis